MTTADEFVRIVWRVADTVAAPVPGSRSFPCSRCGERSWVDPTGTGADVLVCVPCALADPELRPGVLSTWETVRRLGTALPPAFGRRSG